MIISFRRADLLEEAVRNRVYDVFFYIWFATDSSAAGGEGNVVKDHNGCYSANLEVFFPYERLSPWENEAEIKAKIKKKIEDAIGQPIRQRIVSSPNTDISMFYESLIEHFEPKLKAIAEGSFVFDSMVSHGIVFRIGLSAT